MNKVTQLDPVKREVNELLDFVASQEPSDIVICYTTSDGQLMKITSSSGNVSRMTGQLFMMLQNISASDYEE